MSPSTGGQDRPATVSRIQPVGGHGLQALAHETQLSRKMGSKARRLNAPLSMVYQNLSSAPFAVAHKADGPVTTSKLWKV